MTAVAEANPATVPGGLQEYKRRELPDGGLIEFEYAPVGYLKPDGEMRQKDWRAYYFTPQPACEPCAGSGRVPSEKRPGGTVKCQPCKGSGDAKRDRMISVTTLLDGICPKGGLPRWAEARGIEGTVQAFQLGELDHRTDPADAVGIVRLLKLGADRARDTAQERGLNVHALLEEYMRTGEPPRADDHPVEHHGYLQGLSRWLREKDPQPEAVEQLVCDPAAGFAGRRDLVARVGGFRVGYDAKTNENAAIWASSHLQVKLYERAGVACGDEPCDFLRIVVFAADGTFREMECEASDELVARALAFSELMRPVDSLCAGGNEQQKKLRVAA